MQAPPPSSPLQAKHLDWEAPELQYALYRQDAAGHWATSPLTRRCSLAPFQPDNLTSWRQWRNSRLDVRVSGVI